MRQFGRQHYVGSLRAKQGEFDAVHSLTADVRERFTPLWELQPADATEDGDDPTADLDPIIDALPERIHNASLGLEGFLDCSLVHPSRRRSGGEHPVAWTCAAAAAAGTVLTPVVSLQSDADYLDAARTTSDDLHCDVAVRLAIPDLAQISEIVALVAALRLGYDTLHLIIDAEHVVESVAQILPTVLPPLVAPILALGPWKTVTLLSGSIPEDYSALGPGLSLLTRLEWPLWVAVGAAGVLTHRPSFGDYGIAHPVYRYMPWWMRGAAKIRYTGPNDFYIFRGQSLKYPKFGGFNQFRTLAAHLIADSVYRGAAYSSGDKYIDDCAANRVGTGNLQKWVEVGTNQHITYVARMVPTII